MKSNKVYLLHIRDAINAIKEFVKDMSKEEFFRNNLVQSAVIRQVEIIGEATKNLTKEFKRKYRQIPWKEIAGMRDVLIHEYFRVDVDAVWKVINEDIPELENQISEILEELDKD